MNEESILLFQEKMQYIIDSLSAEELLCQLAEECSELAQAVLKYRRCLDGTNPARISKEDAMDHILEEISDVSLVITMLGLETDQNADICRKVMVRKVNRWADSLGWEG